MPKIFVGCFAVRPPTICDAPMTVETTSPLGQRVAEAVRSVRTRAGDPTAAVVVVTPSVGSAELVRRALALAGPFIRVSFAPPGRIVSALGELALAERGLTPEPAGWLGATLREAIRDDETGLDAPGWLPSLEQAVQKLDAAGLDADRLATVTCAPELEGRRDLLARLLGAAHERRSRERLAGARTIGDLALAAVEDRRLAFNRNVGAVVIGDASLTPSQYEVLTAWLADRPGVRLALAPLEHIELAPQGLRRAAAHLEVLDVDVAGEGDVAHLQRHLFKEPTTAAPHDGRVALVTSPDEAREMREVVREVQRAIAAGTPLDRIAIALPDGSTADLLEERLDAAGIPAVWLVGPSLARDRAGRLLRQAIRLASGEDSVAEWYAFLRHPLLRIAPRLGADALRGASQWRRALAECGAVRGTAAIRGALRAALERIDPEEDAWRHAAHTSLLAVIETFADAFAAFPEHDTLGAHAKTWSAFAKTWIGLPNERAQLADVLDAFGDAGPAMDAADALGFLESALAAKPRLEGFMTQPGVRVVPPMELIGGELDVVCLTGLVEGRFPPRRDEDPLLTDALIEAIAASTDVHLLTSRDRADLERRRLAAAIASCTGRLWLSAPSTELMSARPQRPSRLLLDVVATLEGRRASYADLRATQQKVGSRAQFGPEDPKDAIDATEHWVARVQNGEVEALARHATPRRLMQLHRSIDRHRRSAHTDTPFIDAWTGLVSPELVLGPASGDIEARVHVFAEAALQPARYFFRRLLRAYPAPSLYHAYDATSAYVLKSRARAALRAAFDRAGPDLLARFAEVWAEEDEALFAHKPEIDADTIAMAGDLGRAFAETMLAARDDWLAAAPRTVPPNDFDGWSVAADEVLVAGPTLLATRSKAGRKTLKIDDAFAAMLTAAALEDVTDIVHVDPDGGVGTVEVRALSTTVAELARVTRERAAKGLWPMAKGDDKFALALEQVSPVDATDTAALERMLEVVG
ncbi:MAG: hypothetical protein RMA76_03275 [Deltaproteobacteria bacterium]